MAWSPTHSIFVTTNHLPRIDEPEHAVWRRLAMVVFPYRYRKPHEAIEGPNDRRGDAGLRGRLRSPRSKKQREAVLAWLIEGAVKWYQNGQEMPEPPAVVEAAKETWRMQVDVLLRYAAEQPDTRPEPSHRGSEHLPALRAVAQRQRLHRVVRPDVRRAVQRAPAGTGQGHHEETGTENGARANTVASRCVG